MKYKVGDEVLVKAKIIGYLENRRYAVMANVATTVDISLIDKIYIREEDIKELSDMTAEEAWEIAGKIYEEIDINDICDIFGTSEIKRIMKENTSRQAKAKIEAWEAEKDIKVGDVISNPNFGKGVVFGISDDGKYAILTENACSTHGWDRSALKKTGRHIDIEGLLKQIGGDE